MKDLRARHVIHRRRRVKDMTSLRFDRLVVMGRAGNNLQGSATWNCDCRCGRQKMVCGGDLRNGHVRSCGCLLSESSAAKVRLINMGRNLMNGAG
jgi:hypothetical protein